jgi:uncharacterized repeat protein (TIGR03847 family)
MTRRLFIFDSPDGFAPAATGAPGNRSFFLHARQGRAIVTLGLEKMQVAVLAERIGQLLAAADEPASAPGRLGEAGAVESAEPISGAPELFRVGLLAIGWDGEQSKLTVEARPIDEDGEYREAGDDDPDGPDLLRVHLSAGQARAFVRAAAGLVAAGRPTCPFCGQPIEPTGHFCPRTNGHLN